ncbi:MipA/OmpV family protein [Sphingomonas sp. DT-207]|uniref:MipA/OmpV family protein n=1 Tax=Sphingomonas sp. DT-207 TaxID=3396167 RepID=UPI003F19EA1D
MLRRISMPILVLFASAAIPHNAIAQIAAEEEAPGRTSESELTGFVGLGPGLLPRYEGSSDYRLLPFAIGTIRRGGVSVDFQGARLRADLIPDEILALGPLAGVRLGRDDDVDGRVGLLDRIDTAVELGGFVGLRLGGDARGQGQVLLDLTAMADVAGVHDGVLVSATAGYVALRGPQFSLSLDTQATWGDAAYTRTYFGVTPGESARSGLAAYRPEASFRDVGAGATLGYQFDRRWGLIGRIGWTYLVGDAADSPIVRDEGSRHQAAGGIALTYRF